MTCSLRAIVFATAALTVGAQAAENSADNIGKQIFQEGSGDMPACSVCHTLSDAGGTGEIGPNLDDMMPDADRVRVAVHDGVGVMPAYGEGLSAGEIDAVASYVSSVAGR